jgi:hypothetical protein
VSNPFHIDVRGSYRKLFRPLTAVHNSYNLNGMTPYLEASFIDDTIEDQSSDYPLQSDDQEPVVMHYLRGILASYEMFETT